MTRRVSRRQFVQTAAAVGVGAGLMHVHVSGLSAAPLAAGCPNAEKLGWRLGCQAYSFNRFTFFEAVEKTAAVGLKWIEAYPGQKISKELSNKVGPGMSADERKAVKQKLADSGVKLVNFGVTGAGKDVFEFAKDMGIETIVSEPDPKQFDEIEKLCEEFKINVALHNHPKPSRYWDPQVVLDACKGRSRRIGACADTGHWMRSEIKPIDGLRLLRGRIVSFHFKDLNKMGQGAHDVPWGTGAGDAKAALAEVRAQEFAGVFSIEYEHNWDNSLPEIAQCVEFFDKTAAELAAKKA